MSHNIWADLGFDDPEGMQRKCDLSIQIETLMRDARITLRAAAKAMGIAPDELSAILRAHVEDIPVEMLERHLESLQVRLLQRS